MDYVTISNHDDEEIEEEVIVDETPRHESRMGGFDGFFKKKNKKHSDDRMETERTNHDAGYHDNARYEKYDDYELETERDGRHANGEPHQQEESKFKKIMRSLFE
ncbi:TPA: hypothetical protein R9C30_003062 [Staphylococcus aureus]|nr:hypothetical protein [Staphylococcus aureus]